MLTYGLTFVNLKWMASLSGKPIGVHPILRGRVCLYFALQTIDNQINMVRYLLSVIIAFTPFQEMRN